MCAKYTSLSPDLLSPLIASPQCPHSHCSCTLKSMYTSDYIVTHADKPIPLLIYHLPTVPIPAKVQNWTYWRGSIPAQVKACTSLRKCLHMGVKYFRILFTENLLLIHKIATSKMPGASPCPWGVATSTLEGRSQNMSFLFYTYNMTQCHVYCTIKIKYTWTNLSSFQGAALKWQEQGLTKE